MPWRDNKGKDTQIEENKINTGTDKAEKNAPISPAARKASEDVQNLKERIEEIKARSAELTEMQTLKEVIGDQASGNTKDSGDSTLESIEKRYTTKISLEEIAAAEEAVKSQAMRERRNERIEQQQKSLEKDARVKAARIREKEARRLSKEKMAEAEAKLKAAQEAKARAEAMARKREMTEKVSKIREENRKAGTQETGGKEREILLGSDKMQREHKIDLSEKLLERQLEERKRLNEQQVKEEKKRLAAAEKRRIAEERRVAEERRRQQELDERRARQAAQEKERAEKEKAAQKLKAAREAAALKARAEKEAIKKAREEELRRIKQEKEAQKAAAIKARLELKEKKKKEAREKKLERLAEIKKREERDLLIAKYRAIQKAKRNKERKEQREREEAARREREARIKKERAERAALNRERRFARKSAKKGGGLVKVHGTTVQTEIQPVAAFSLSALLGRARRKDIKNAVTEEERQQLIQESERTKVAARAALLQLMAGRRIRRENSVRRKRRDAFMAWCEEKKKGLFIGFAVLLALAIGTAGVLNYCTAFEYSYNGAKLGYVKERDTVLKITELVEGALTKEKDVKVVVDARKDISFRRVYTLNKDIAIDTSDDVLKRMTYAGDLNVKAYGIYIDGQKVGAVANKDAAATVLTDIMEKYASNKKGAKIEEAVIVEDIKIRQSNTDLKDVLTERQMVDKLCTSGEKKSVYTVARGDTLVDIARDHGLTEDDIIKENPGINREKLKVGSTLVIKENAPIMTVKITEVRSYEKKTDYETIKKKDKDIYEGFTEVAQKGEKGLSKLTDRTISINGDVVETVNLKNDVKKEPVEKIVKVGTKERPPTVGSGTYVWPAYSGTYTVTSEFKWRWGRQHQGIDMGCPVGTDVLASDGGTVTYAGYMGGYGLLVIIDHQNGVETYYGHNSSLLVSVGDKVFQGQHIAEAGNTGRSTGPHIHFGVKDHGTFNNPRNYLP